MIIKDDIMFVGKDGNDLKALLGGKGAGLMEMKKLGVNVPPFVVIPTSTCREFMKNPSETMQGVQVEMPKIRDHLKSQFGYMPLVSVRSGSRVSMPGMMDTILNVGLDFSTMPEWEDRLGASCAWDSFSRLVMMYGDVVKGLPRANLEPLEHDGVIHSDIAFENYKALSGESFPEADEQLFCAIEAVFKSWDNERAKVYRKLNNIPEDWGTAVVVHSMVFGNLNDNSCTGVLFTRNPSNGVDEITGEFLVNAQGEDVVAGIRTPMPLSELKNWNKDVALQLADQVTKLEHHYKDMQDVEFTVQDGQLFILQTRTGKRTAKAAIRIAVDLYNEGLITAKEAANRVSMKQYFTALKPVIDPTFTTPATGKGIPASSGIAMGRAVFSAEKAVQASYKCILISHETTPNDIAGMNASEGILTAIGGATSHAAVVARGMDKTCVVGCTDLSKDVNGSWVLNGKVIQEMDVITLNGDTGEIWVGVEVLVVESKNDPYIQEFLSLVKSATNSGMLITTPDQIVDGVEQWLTTDDQIIALWAVEKLTGYLDIRGKSDYTPPEFSAIVVAGSPSTPSTENVVVGALVASGLNASELKCKIVVSSNLNAQLLKNAGFEVVKNVQAWEDLLYVDQEIVGGASYADNQNAERVLELRAKANLPVSSIGVGYSAGKNDTKVFMSEAQILSNLLS